MNILFLLLALGSFLLYFPAKEHQIRGHFLKTKLDDRIRPIPIFVIPYLLFFPYIIGTLLWGFFTANTAFAQLAISMTAVSVLTTAIYIIYPSMMIRPFTAGGLIPQTWTEKTVRAIEKFDRPDNVFPSNHVAYSLVATMFLTTAIPAMAPLFWLCFGLIAASTILIKQHYLIDVPAGAALALGVWLIVGLLV